jgi:hypothetical protein
MFIHQSLKVMRFDDDDPEATKIAENTVIDRQMVDIIRSSGRGSFTWRIARDQRALSLIGEHPVLGTARWDWWRRNGERPWGLALLIFGQFGLIGSALAFGSLLTPVWRAFAIHWRPGAWRLYPAPPMAVIVLMAISDALLNSFFFIRQFSLQERWHTMTASSFVLLAPETISPIVKEDA